MSLFIWDKSHYRKTITNYELGITNEDVPFEVPESWEWCKIKMIGEVITGNTPPKEQKEYYGNDYPFYKPTDLEQGISVIKATDNLSSLGYAKARQLPPFSILVTCIGATIGKIGLIRNEGTCNQQINAIIPNICVVDKFMYYSCLSDYFQSQIVDNSSATTLPIINKSKFEQLLISLPPIAEQHRIVSKIEECFALIDEIESSKFSLSQFIQQTKSKVLDLAIRGKLVPQDPNESITNYELKITKKTADIFHYTDNFEIPKSWVWSKLGNIAKHNTGKALDKSRNSGTLREYITTSNLYWGYFDLTELRKMPIEDNELDRCTAIAGDLLVCEGGDAGRSAIWKSDHPICFQNHIHRVKPFANINTTFLYYFIQYIYLNGDIKQYLKGVGIQSLSGNSLASIPIPIPPLSEQHRIVQKIESIFQTLDCIQNNL